MIALHAEYVISPARGPHSDWFIPATETTTKNENAPLNKTISLRVNTVENICDTVSIQLNKINSIRSVVFGIFKWKCYILYV